MAVGGTTLSLNPDGTVASETAWSGSGGGISAYEIEPQFQIAYNLTGTNGKRAVPDISYNANPATGFSVFTTTAYQGQIGWFQLGGTSAGAPQWAAIHSLGLSVSNNNLYQDAKLSYPAYFRDVTVGSNGAYSAALGYDFVTGLGSPITSNFARAAVLTGFSVTNGGSGYTTPAVVISGGGGTGASATARVSNGVVLGLVLTNPGTGYTTAPTVTLRDPSPRAKGAVVAAIMTETG